MKVLVGSLGKLGFLVRNVRPGEGTREWSILPDEASLTRHLTAVRMAETEIRGMLRRIRAEGRAVVTIDDRPRPVH